MKIINFEVGKLRKVDLWLFVVLFSYIYILHKYIDVCQWLSIKLAK